MSEKQISKAENQGRMAATKWETPACPYVENSEQAGQWCDGLLAGRYAFSWNVRNLVQIGATCRYLSEAVSTEIAISVAKSVLFLAAESAVMFRIGFVLASHDNPVPTMPIDGWRRVAQVVNRAMQGRELDDIGLTSDPSWLERLAFYEARDFMLSIIGHPAPADPTEKPSFQVDLGKLIPWMGAKSEHHRGLVPKSIDC